MLRGRPVTIGTKIVRNARLVTFQIAEVVVVSRSLLQQILVAIQVPRPVPHHADLRERERHEDADDVELDEPGDLGVVDEDQPRSRPVWVLASDRWVWSGGRAVLPIARLQGVGTPRIDKIVAERPGR